MSMEYGQIGSVMIETKTSMVIVPHENYSGVTNHKSSLLSNQNFEIS